MLGSKWLRWQNDTMPTKINLTTKWHAVRENSGQQRYIWVCVCVWQIHFTHNMIRARLNVETEYILQLAENRSGPQSTRHQLIWLSIFRSIMKFINLFIPWFLIFFLFFSSLQILLTLLLLLFIYIFGFWVEYPKPNQIDRCRCLLIIQSIWE